MQENKYIWHTVSLGTFLALVYFTVTKNIALFRKNVNPIDQRISSYVNLDFFFKLYTFGSTMFWSFQFLDFKMCSC